MQTTLAQETSGLQATSAHDVFVSVPNSLKLLPRWVSRKGKIPFQLNLQPASVTDPTHWGAFEDVIGVSNQIGFVLGDGICGIDLDNCFESDGEALQPWAQEIILSLDSYTERSPSGKGAHIFVKGELPAIGRRKGSIEIYDRARFFTVTGHWLHGIEIEDRQAELTALHGRIFGQETIDPAKLNEAERSEHSDSEVLEALNRSKEQGEKFRRLMKGELNGYSSQSEGDLALCRLIAFYTRDESQIWRIIQRSALYDKKWNRADYSQNTIRKAIASVRDSYQWTKAEKSNGLALEVQSIDAGDWLDEPLEPIDSILDGLLSVGDKLLVCGKSKTRKSFLKLQFAVSIASGRNFLAWRTNRKRRVLIVQLEIQPKWFHRRLKRMCQALKVSAEDLRGWLTVVNGRGKPISVESIRSHAERLKPEVILIDPIYKLADFDENDTAEWKKLLRGLDELGEQLGATICFVHHDRKGLVSEDAADRGSGSGLLGRDWDSFLGLARHAQNRKLVVLDAESRNFPPNDGGVSLAFNDGAFEVCDVPAITDTRGAENPTSEIPLEAFIEPAVALLEEKPLPPKQFKDAIQQTLGLTQERTRALYDVIRSSGLIAVLSGRRKERETDLVGHLKAIERLRAERIGDG